MKKKSIKGEFALNERIKYLRKVRNLTQAELAEKAGVRQSALAQFEKGDHAPRVSTLMVLANALDIAPALFFRSDEVIVFDLPKLAKFYKTKSQLPEGLYKDIAEIFSLAKKLGFE